MATPFYVPIIIPVLLIQWVFAGDGGVQPNVSDTPLCSATSGNANCPNVRDPSSRTTPSNLPFPTTHAPQTPTSEERTEDEFVVYDNLINLPDAQEYLASFQDEFQRTLIKKTLQFCPYIRLCNFTFGVEPSPMESRGREPCCSPCSCGLDCLEQGTCCPDHRSLSVVPMLRSQDSLITETCIDNSIRADASLPSGSGFRFKAVTSCPPGAESSVRVRCSYRFDSIPDLTFDDVIPQSDIVTKRTYRNRHCALCNGANMTNLAPWNAKMDCVETPPSFASTGEFLTGLLAGTIPCVVTFASPMSVNVEYCSDVINACNATGKWAEFDPIVDRACGSYGTKFKVYTNIKDTTAQFKNPFCALCNGFDPSTPLCDVVRKDPGDQYAFSGLLRVESFRDSEDGPQRTACGPGLLFDDIKNRCQNVTCAYHRTFKHGVCDVFLETSKTIGYRVFAVTRPLVNTSLNALFDVMPELRTQFEEELYRSIVGSLCASQTMIVLKDEFSEDDKSQMVESVEFRYDIVPYEEVIIDNTVDSLLRLDGVLHFVGFSSGYVVGFNVSLKDDVRGYNEKVPYDKFDNQTLARTPIPLQDLYHLSFTENGRRLMPYFNWGESSDRCSFKVRIQRLLTLRSCPMYSVNKTEFGLKESPNGLELIADEGNIVVRLSEYVIDANDEFVRMCIETYKRVFGSDAKDDVTVDILYKAEIVVSIVSISVSIVCLIISLATYCYLPQLRTLPGKNNMALIASLLLSQGMYLLSSYSRFDTASFSCKLVGGLTHFSWLLAIFWMNVCTFHMFRVLSSMRDASSSSAPNTKHIRYHAYSILLSALFVGANVVVSMVTSEYSDYGYGGSRCYISTQRMIETTFGIPAAVVVLANLSMFITIIVKLKRAPVVNKNVKNDRNYALVFAKLSTITGATWLFGFVYMWTGVAAFSFIFIILNGSQGVFLMLSFVCNARTLSVLKDKGKNLVTSFTGTQSSSLKGTSSNMNNYKQSNLA